MFNYLLKLSFLTIQKSEVFHPFKDYVAKSKAHFYLKLVRGHS